MTTIATPDWYVPQILAWGGAPNISQNHLMDANGEFYTLVFRVPKTGTLDTVELLLNTVTTAPTNGLRFAFGTIDADGTTFTEQQYRVYAQGSISSNKWLSDIGLITSDGSDTGTKRSVTQGDVMALKVTFDGTYVDGNLNIGLLNFNADAISNVYGGFPYEVGPTGTTRTMGRFPALALKYNDGSYATLDGGVPIKSSAASTYASNTSSGSGGDERGLRGLFAMEVSIDGVWVRMLGANTSATFDVVIEGGGLGSPVTVAGNLAQAMSATNGYNHLYRFPAITLAANTAFTVSIRPATTNTVSIYEGTVDSTAIMGAWGPGAEWYHVTRTDGGAWTTTTTKRPIMGVKVASVTVAASGGGLLRHPGMSGGLDG